MRIVITPIRGGSKAAIRKLDQMIRETRSPHSANREVSVWLMRWVNVNFKSQGGNVGGWLPFKHGGRKMPGGSIDSSAKLLQDTGRLRASFSPFHSRTEAGVGSDLRYSITHELGRPFVRLPSRRMLPLASDKSVEHGIIQIYDRWIKRAISK